VNSKVDVAIIAGDLVPTGGMDMPNLALASYLARVGHRVEVVTFRADPSLALSPRVRLHRVVKPLDSYTLGAPFLGGTGRYIARRVLRRGGRVVANGGNCHAGDVNWVHYVHAAYARSAPPGWRAGKHLIDRVSALATERQALRAARLVLANSVRTRNDLLERLDLHPERVEVVYYGVDDRFAPPTAEERAASRAALGLGDRPTLAFVGALGDHRKGFDTLFDAWSELGQDWDAVLLVIGRGALQEFWQARARAAGFESIRFLGFRRDVPQILYGVDGMVAPTRYEAFGQAVQEAVCCGVPVIVSAGAGVVERLGEALSPLMLLDAESSSELVARLRRWREEVDAFRMAARVRSAVLRERTWDVMAEQIRGLLCERS
jgi:glycosyltransferase involved in cell wall biosynthesis